MRFFDYLRGFLVRLGLYSNAVLASLVDERVGIGAGLLEQDRRGLVQLLELFGLLGERLQRSNVEQPSRKGERKCKFRGKVNMSS